MKLKKLMKTENLWIVCITVVLLGLIVSITTYNIVVDKAAIGQGLHQGSLQGCNGVYWVK